VCVGDGHDRAVRLNGYRRYAAPRLESVTPRVEQDLTLQGSFKEATPVSFGRFVLGSAAHANAGYAWSASPASETLRFPRLFLISRFFWLTRAVPAVGYFTLCAAHLSSRTRWKPA
jgi:hypothetical protein